MRLRENPRNRWLVFALILLFGASQVLREHDKRKYDSDTRDLQQRIDRNNQVILDTLLPRIDSLVAKQDFLVQQSNEQRRIVQEYKKQLERRIDQGASVSRPSNLPELDSLWSVFDAPHSPARE